MPRQARTQPTRIVKRPAGDAVPPPVEDVEPVQSMRWRCSLGWEADAPAGVQRSGSARRRRGTYSQLGSDAR